MSPQVICITGATSGIGEATVRRMAAEGHRLILVGRRQERLEALGRELGHVPLHLVPLDVRNRQAVEQMVQHLPPSFAEVDVLVNNAGLCLGLESAEQCDLNEWETMVDTNIKGLMTMTHAMLQRMVPRRRGLIINIGSIAGTYAYPGGNCYGATKAFVEQFSLNLRADLAGKNIRVTNLMPGLTETEFSVVRFRGDRERADTVYQGVRPLYGEDIAQCIHWLCQLPEHMNINQLEVMPSCQAFAPLAIHRS